MRTTPWLSLQPSWSDCPDGRPLRHLCVQRKPRSTLAPSVCVPNRPGQLRDILLEVIVAADELSTERGAPQGLVRIAYDLMHAVRDGCRVVGRYEPSCLAM